MLSTTYYILTTYSNSTHTLRVESNQPKKHQKYYVADIWFHYQILTNPSTEVFLSEEAYITLSVCISLPLFLSWLYLMSTTFLVYAILISGY